jgi:SAM-dependent methyltransferase
MLANGPLEPSPWVRRFAHEVAIAARGLPILDVACGSGRNAVAFGQLGCRVVCVDRDLVSLRTSRRAWRTGPSRSLSSRLRLHEMDLIKDPWPFGPGTVGGILNIHFLLRALFPHFVNCLALGGHLLLETVPGCGGNYLELPKKGELRSELEAGFELLFYQERKVGPMGFDAVTVKLLARKKVKRSRAGL